ncbi:MAG: hypothetical protein KA604_01505 [Candidatus Saccharimonas sp.]|jgi:hypothetical protein|nr:hypothetical protein [Candidatus Saccharimonas sp.]
MLKYAFIVFVTAITMFVGAIYFSGEAHAACKESSFGIPTWYRGLKVAGCNTGVSPDGGNIGKFITILALNIIQALMVIAAYVTVFFIIKGGFNYMTSAGSPEGMASARKTITNAVIGLVITILSASIVNAIAGAIK